MALLPVQPPEAVQEVALVDDHVSCVLPPLATLVGFAASVTVGDGSVTATTTESVAAGPSPLQVKVNVASAVSTPVLSDPDVGLLPLQLPAAEQEVASVLVHDSMVDVPDTTDVTAAVMSTVGAAELLLSSEEEEQPASIPRTASSAPARLIAPTPARSMNFTINLPRRAFSSSRTAAAATGDGPPATARPGSANRASRRPSRSLSRRPSHRPSHRPG